MCGISGLLGPGAPDEKNRELAAMNGRLRHRGPDADGFWSDELCALGHRRLSILDLSPNGAQPMESADRRWVLSFNGEIYNHLSLRRELPSRSYRGHSDTETILAAVSQWGVEQSLRKMAGMFAFALWDRHEKRLWIARDRMGEKPLYYGSIGGQLAFASELKALRAHSAFRERVSREALRWLLTLGYIPAPLSIQEGVFKLPPAHFLSLRSPVEKAQPLPYWELPRIARESPPLDESEAEARLEDCLREVLREQRVADVPIGCFLSGGIDSSLISALLCEQGGAPPRSFSIGFEGEALDESGFAREVARKLGTVHTELRATPEAALEAVTELPEIYDEPFADASAIPTLLLARLARPHVTVALSGDGGDEVFAGYNRYLFLEQARSLPGLLSPFLRLAPALAASAPGRWLERALKLPQIDEKLRKLHAVRSAPSSAAAYWALAAQGLEAPAALPLVEAQAAGLEGVAGLQLRDQLLYLPDDILVKVDRAAMAASLETRAPFLDHRVVELAWKLPAGLRTGRGRGKILLRKLLAKRLDPALWERPKAGFSPPIGSWLRGKLRPWAEELLSEASLRDSGIPGADRIRSCWLRERSAERSGHGAFRLWPALMAQAWLRRER